MFEQRGWQRVDRIEGDCPSSPAGLTRAEVLGWADRAPISGEWLDAVRAIDPASLSGGDRLGLVRAWDRLRRGMDAGFTAALGSIAARPCRPEPGDPSCDGGPTCDHDWSTEDTVLALGVGRGTAGHLLAESRELLTRLPGLLAEVAEGTCSLTHARRAAARTRHVADDDIVAAIAVEIAGLAGKRTVMAFDRIVATIIEKLRDPDDVLAEHRDAARRETGIRPLAPMTEGLAAAVITGPADRIAALFGWARGFTKLNRDPDDPRTVGQRRFDALLAGVLDPQPDLAANPDATDPGADGDPATAGAGTAGANAPDRPAWRTPISLRLVLSASTLLGHDNEPGWLEGHGDLPAALARALAVQPATTQRLLAHPRTGELLDLTPELRVPSAALDRYIRARDGICGGPGCGATADTADLDHIRPVRDGGPTTRDNLHPVCRRSHRQRHAGGYTIRRDPDGSEVWTDPHGNTYQTEPTRYATGPSCPSDGDPELPNPGGGATPWTDNDDFDELETMNPPARGDTPRSDDDSDAAGTPPDDDPCPFLPARASGAARAAPTARGGTDGPPWHRNRTAPGAGWTDGRR